MDELILVLVAAIAIYIVIYRQNDGKNVYKYVSKQDFYAAKW